MKLKTSTREVFSSWLGLLRRKYIHVSAHADIKRMCCSPNSGGSQLTLASQWESRKVMTSPLAAEAPSRRVLMSPSLFLVLRIRTFGIRFMYSSSGTFRCSAESAERQIISMTRCQYSGFSRHLSSIPGETVEWRQQESSFFISLVGSWGGRWSLA